MRFRMSFLSLIPSLSLSLKLVTTRPFFGFLSGVEMARTWVWLAREPCPLREVNLTRSKIM